MKMTQSTPVQLVLFESLDQGRAPKAEEIQETIQRMVIKPGATVKEVHRAVWEKHGVRINLSLHPNELPNGTLNGHPKERGFEFSVSDGKWSGEIKGGNRKK